MSYETASTPAPNNTLTAEVADPMAPAAAAQRWMGVAAVDPEDAAADTYAAIRDGVDQAMTGDDVGLVVVMAAEALDPQEVARAASDAAPGAAVIGCSTGGEITSLNGITSGGASIFVLGGPGFSLHAQHSVFDGDAFEVGRSAAESAAHVEGEHRLLLMLCDGLIADQQDFVRGAYAEAGPAVPLVGGGASDNSTFDAAWQFHGREVFRGAVAVAIGSDSPLGIGIQHGWEPIGEPVLVTRTDGMKIVELDGRPATEVWAERCGLKIESIVEGDKPIEEVTITRPLGLMRTERIEVRALSTFDFEEGTLTSVSAIAEGEYAWVMTGEAETVLDGTGDSVRQAIDQLEGVAPLGLVAFGCVARSLVLGQDRLHEEADRIRDAAPGVPVAGFHTFGEIARSKGSRGFHNQTLVTLAIS